MTTRTTSKSSRALDNDQPEGERPIDLYTEAFGQLQQGLSETDADLLGVVYEELGMDSDAFGQYFTPHNVCEAKAEMVITADEDTDREEPYTVADPASGSGRLLIYAAKKIPDDVDAVFYGQDKDSTCAKMTALNFCFFNMTGYAVLGDSLKLEQHRAWQTHSTALGGEIQELEEDELPEIDYETVREETEADDEQFPEMERSEVDLVELEDTEDATLSDFTDDT